MREAAAELRNRGVRCRPWWCRATPSGSSHGSSLVAIYVHTRYRGRRYVVAVYIVRGAFLVLVLSAIMGAVSREDARSSRSPGNARARGGVGGVDATSRARAPCPRRCGPRRSGAGLPRYSPWAVLVPATTFVRERRQCCELRWGYPRVRPALFPRRRTTQVADPRSRGSKTK